MRGLHTCVTGSRTPSSEEVLSNFSQLNTEERSLSLSLCLCLSVYLSLKLSPRIKDYQGGRDTTSVMWCLSGIVHEDETTRVQCDVCHEDEKLPGCVPVCHCPRGRETLGDVCLALSTWMRDSQWCLSGIVHEDERLSLMSVWHGPQGRETLSDVCLALSTRTRDYQWCLPGIVLEDERLSVMSVWHCSRGRETLSDVCLALSTRTRDSVMSVWHCSRGRGTTNDVCLAWSTRTRDSQWCLSGTVHEDERLPGCIVMSVWHCPRGLPGCNVLSVGHCPHLCHIAVAVQTWPNIAGAVDSDEGSVKQWSINCYPTAARQPTRRL